MRSRCENVAHQSYRHYGGRGISVCAEWRHSFEAFLSYVGRRPSPQHTLDRFPNNDGNYEPGNVRWATKAEQVRNTRRTRNVTFRGETKVVMDWSKSTGLHDNTLYGRLDAGVPVDVALTHPPGLRYRMLEMDGQSRTVSEWSRLVGLDCKTITYRLGRGMSVAAALTTPRRGGRRPS